MHAPASRRQPSARSRMLSSTGSPRAGRGLGDVVTGIVHGVSGVVHDVSGVAYDVGNAVDDALRGHLSKLPGDFVQTGIDLAKTGKYALGVAPGALDPSNNHDSGGDGSGSGAQSHSSGATQPTPPAAPGAGGGEGGAQTASRPVSSSTATPPASATSPSSENSAHAPSTSIHTVVRTANFGWHPQTVNALGYGGAGPEGGQDGNGVRPAPSSTAADTQSLTTTMALPSNSSSAAAAHRKGFPLAAAAALGAVLGFLVVSALFWAVWLYLRKRRALRAMYLPPRRMLSVTTAGTVSTVPLFISASEAGVKDDNPFKHPRDAHEDDPFDAASLWRSSTTRSASTLSV